MEKNVILAVVLSILVLLAYNILITKFVETPVTPEGEQAFVEEDQDKIMKEEIRKEGAAPVSILQPQERLEGSEEKEIQVETPLFKGVITNQGGGIKTWELKSYRESLEEDSPPVKVVSPNGLGRYPFEVSILDPFSGIEERLTLSPTKEGLSLEEGEKGELVLSGESSDGLTVVERLTFSGDSYAVDMEIDITNSSPEPFNGLLSINLIGHVEEAKKSSWYAHIGPVSYIDEGVKREEAKEVIKEGRSYEGNILWTSIEDKYFIESLLPSASKETKLRMSALSEGLILSRFLPQQKPLYPQETRSYSFKLYIGPKELDSLKGMGKHLEEIIDFGYFGFLAKPLLLVLKFFYSFLFNYGLAIILLTTLIKIIFYPLTRHSLKSMKEMQKLQPQMAAIRKRYKDSKEKMNKELMELYKRNKINPLGGCLPMILQIPVFIALYNVLLTSIELRHTPFFLWIRDLSAKDPYYISPILMGASMLLQQKMSPTAMDPQQAKIMLLMPIFFTFLFLNFPSGLVLYWLVNNLLQIGQQYYIQKKG